MPFKSEAQRRFLFAKHPEIAKRWAAHTPKGAKLPGHVKRADEYNIPHEFETTRRHGVESDYSREGPSGEARAYIDSLPRKERAELAKKTKRADTVRILKSLRAKGLMGRAEASVYRKPGLAVRLAPVAGYGAGSLTHLLGNPVPGTAEAFALYAAARAKKWAAASRYKKIAKRPWAKQAAFIAGFFDELLKMAQEDDEDEALKQGGVYGQILRLMKRLGAKADPDAVERFKRLAYNIPSGTA